VWRTPLNFLVQGERLDCSLVGLDGTLIPSQEFADQTGYSGKPEQAVGELYAEDTTLQRTRYVERTLSWLKSFRRLRYRVDRARRSRSMPSSTWRSWCSVCDA
jgi:hypothetical protein